MTAPGSMAVTASPNATLRRFAEQALSRVAGAPLIGGNTVDLLIDGRANFGAWLAAIRSARTSILLENYIFSDDELSREIREALTQRARAGVRVCVIRDWLGCIGESRDRFWRPLRAAGGDVRTYNPLRFTSPFGWISRDHRKLLVVDSDVGFVSGVCVSGRWLGDPARGIPPWRDTGISVRGPGLREIAAAFADNWASLGEALPADLPVLNDDPPAAGDVDLRVIATLPSMSGLYRLDQLIATLATRTLWLTDAYFVGTGPYVQSLVAAVRDGVDVRLLVPGTSDLPIVGALSRSGYRSLLAAGIRVYEWNGMLHAKTAVADGRWARVGSSNLNIASWMANSEIDVAIENEPFARRMQEQYEQDLGGATEIVLHRRSLHSRPTMRVARQSGRLAAPSSSSPYMARSGRTATGAMRVANTVSAAIADRRVLGSAESSNLLGGAGALSAVAVVGLCWPRVLAWPLATLAAWCAVSLVARTATLRRGTAASAVVEPPSARKAHDDVALPRGAGR